ncbi:MAG: hypothetical protein ACRCZK_02735 [Oscillospiraceae bacterium]
MKLTKKFISMCLLLVFMVSITSVNADAASQLKTYNIPGNKGVLESHTWVGWKTRSGNTYQWDYQVAAKYKGNREVEWIKTEWRGLAQLKNSASLNIGIKNDGVLNAGYSSSWQTKYTRNAMWINTKGQKDASYRSNMVIAPRMDYRNNSRNVTNMAQIKLRYDTKAYIIYSGV